MKEKEFVTEYVDEFRSKGEKTFPQDFLESSNTKEVQMPNKRLVLGHELFGTFEIIDSDGNVYFQAQSMGEAKYYLYSNRQLQDKIHIPLDEGEVIATVKRYEKMLDEILMDLEKRYKKAFPNEKNFHSVSNQVFHALNLQRY